LAQLIREKHIPRIPIFLDSPMAITATHAYAKYDELFDVESTTLIDNDQLEKDLSSLHFCETADESRAINDAKPPFVVIAGAGMLNAGRIMHHVRHNISDPNSHIVIVGYQSRGSLGRRLVDGADHISIMGDYKPVRAQIHTLGGFSAHAGQTDLLRWITPMAASKPQVFLTHGEDDARVVLQTKLAEQFGIEAELPTYAAHLEIV
jgi:metallo-beta-lactamase family protein